MTITTTITVKNTSETQIYVNATYNSDGTLTRRINWIIDGNYDGYTIFTETTSASEYHTFTGLSSGTSYTLTASFLDSSGSEVGRASTSGTTDKSRPSNFNWTYTKSSGVSFIVTANEWNSLFSKINEFRSYKGLSYYSHSTAYTGIDFLASQYNEARNAISSMSPSISVPAYRNSGETIYANDINGLRDSLNSIT